MEKETEMQYNVKEEYELADQLKQICDSNGNEIDPKQSAEIFHKLGQIYYKRNTMVSLIRSATFYNAAITRKPDNLQDIENDLKLLCSHALKEAGASKLDADLIGAANDLKKDVQKLRISTNEKLQSLKKAEIINKTKEENENTKIEMMKHLQNKIANDYVKMMSELLSDCQTVMGNPPCRFAVVGMGSLARKEITPYSDFEHIIVLEENAQNRPDYDEILKYFRWLSVIFQIVIINLQETIIPSVDIESLKSKGKGKKNWFYDGITTRGICFDGMMPHACKFPLGQQVLSGKKKNKTELIKPVDGMLEYLTSHNDLKSGYHLKDILTKTCYVGGDKQIFDNFQTKVFNLLDNQDKEENKKQIEKILIEDLDNFATRSNFLNLQSKSFNIKKDLYRSTTIFISALGQIENIHASSCFDIVEELAKTEKISDKTKHKLMYAVAIGCEVRLRRYMKFERQYDEIKQANSCQEAIQDVLQDLDLTSLISYFQIAYALQCHVSKLFDLKKIHFYSDPRLLNCKLYYCFRLYQQFFDFVNQAKQEGLIQISRLQSIDEILEQLEKSPNLLNYKTNSNSWINVFLMKMQNSVSAYKFCERIFVTGSTDDAIEMFEIFLELSDEIQNQQKIKEGKLCFTEEERNVCIDVSKLQLYALGLMGFSHFNNSNLGKAIEYFQRFMKNLEKTSHNTLVDATAAEILSIIGCCYFRLMKPADALVYYQRATEIYESISLVGNQKFKFVNTLNVTGLCYLLLNKASDAIEFFKKSFEIFQKSAFHLPHDFSFKDILEDKSFLRNMHSLVEECNDGDSFLKSFFRFLSANPLFENVQNISDSYSDSFTSNDRLDYLQRSLADKENASLDVSTDISLAETLRTLGLCLIKKSKHVEAWNYLQRSLKIMEKVSSDNSSDENMAFTLNITGVCLLKMNRPADAVKYLKRCLGILEKTTTDVSANFMMLSLQGNVAFCLIEINEFTDAIYHLQQCLQILKTASPNSSLDLNVARLLGVISLCFTQMCKPNDALKYKQEMQNILDKISSDASMTPRMAEIINLIKDCFTKTNKPELAKEILQRLLKVQVNLDKDKFFDADTASMMADLRNSFLKLFRDTDYVG